MNPKIRPAIRQSSSDRYNIHNECDQREALRATQAYHVQQAAMQRARLATMPAVGRVARSAALLLWLSPGANLVTVSAPGLVRFETREGPMLIGETSSTRPAAAADDSN